MHAAELASNLSIPRVLVPRAAGTLSALGMLLADFVRDYSQTLMVQSSRLDKGHLETTFTAMEKRARQEYRDQGFDGSQLEMERSVDMRYVGQGYELNVSTSDNLDSSFHVSHEQRYGYADERRPTEVVNVRLRAVGQTEKPPIPEHQLEDQDPTAAAAGDVPMVFDGVTNTAPVFDRSRLRAGNAFRGPALVVEYSTTTVVPPGFDCTVDRFENLILEQEAVT